MAIKQHSVIKHGQVTTCLPKPSARAACLVAVLETTLRRVSSGVWLFHLRAGEAAMNTARLRSQARPERSGTCAKHSAW